jgi:ribonuclease P protein component
VLRNRIRRRLRRAVPEAALTSGFDYVIIADRRVADTSFQELVGWIREAGQ